MAATRYAPRGIRSFGPTRSLYGVTEVPGKTWLFAMIETRLGLANVEEIAAVDGIDGLLMGPSDLTLDLGHSFTAKLDPEVDAAMGRISAAFRARGKMFVSTWFFE